MGPDDDEGVEANDEAKEAGVDNVVVTVDKVSDHLDQVEQEADDGQNKPGHHKSGLSLQREIKIKHRKNCECCPRHSLIKGHKVIVNIVVLICQQCNRCLKCQVSGHKIFKKIGKKSENLKKFQKSENCHHKLSSKIVIKIVIKNCR